MRRLDRLTTLCILSVALAACGDGKGTTGGGGAGETTGGSGGSVVGAWGIDVAQTVEHGLPAAKRGMAKAREQFANAPPEVRATAEARMPKDDAAIRADIEKNAKATEFVLDLRGDGTAKLVFKAPFGESIRECVWEQKGDDLWLTTKTKDGSPATGREAQPQRFVRKGAHLVLLDDDGNQVFWLRRS